MRFFISFPSISSFQRANVERKRTSSETEKAGRMAGLSSARPGLFGWNTIT
jgi:hypothetical protein